MGLPYTLEPQLDQNSVFIGLSQTNVSTSAVTIQQSYFLDCIEQVERLKMNLRSFPEYQSHLAHFNKCAKEIKMILRLFLVIAMYCQASSSQIKSITQPLPLLASWRGSLGTCSRQQFTRNNLYTILISLVIS